MQNITPIIKPTTADINIVPFSIPNKSTGNVLANDEYMVNPKTKPNIPIIALIIFCIKFSPPDCFVNIYLL